MTTTTTTLRIRETTFQDAFDQMSGWPLALGILGKAYFQDNKERLMTLDTRCFDELHALLDVPEDPSTMYLGEPDDRNPDGYFYAKFYTLAYPILEKMEHPRQMTPAPIRHPYLCEECDTNIAEHNYVGSCDRVYRLCDPCMEYVRNDEDIIEEEENLGTCVSCKKEQAVISFMHLTNGNFELCKHCFQWADHEDDYGKNFEK